MEIRNLRRYPTYHSCPEDEQDPKDVMQLRGWSGATEICCGAMCRARYLGKHFPTGLLNDIAENKNLVASFGTFPAVVQSPEIPRPKARSSSLTSLGSLRRDDCPSGF